MKRLTHVCMCITSIAFLNSLYTNQPAANLPPMSNEEQMLAQQLDSVFEELTKGMSENEKNQFFTELNTQMEAEIEKMSKMSDAELNKYIQDAENELKNLGQMPDQVAPVQPIQPIAPTETKKTEPVKEEQKKPSRDMAPAIAEIVARIDSFLQKANQINTIPAKFEKWGKKGKLRGWNPTMTWAVFKEKIDSLKKTLLTIKSLDPKTQKPKYLTDLTTDEKLCNNINQFKTVLVKHEPGIQTPSFGSKKLSKPSKNAIVAVINDCLEAVLALNMQVELEKIITKYEPTAKKIKDAEEAAQKKALEVSKQRPTTPGAIKTTVRPGEEVGYYEMGVSGRPSGYPYGPSYGPSSYGPTPPSPFGPEKKAESDIKDNKAKDGAKPESGKAPEAKKEDKKGPETKKEDAQSDAKTLERLQQKIEEFQGNLSAAQMAGVDCANHLSYMSSQEKNKIDKLAGEVNLAEISLKTARTALSQAQGSITQLKTNEEKAKWASKFQSGWNELKSDFDRLKQGLEANIPKIATQSSSTPTADLKKAKDTLQESAEKVVSLINDIDMMTKNLSAQKSRSRIRVR